MDHILSMHRYATAIETESVLNELESMFSACEAVMADVAMEGTNNDGIDIAMQCHKQLKSLKKDLKLMKKTKDYKGAAAKANEIADVCESAAADINKLPQSTASMVIGNILYTLSYFVTELLVYIIIDFGFGGVGLAASEIKRNLSQAGGWSLAMITISTGTNALASKLGLARDKDDPYHKKINPNDMNTLLNTLYNDLRNNANNFRKIAKKLEKKANKASSTTISE